MQSGTLTTAVNVNLGDGSPIENAFMMVQLAGTFTGTVTFQGTVDGTNWVNLAGLPLATLFDTSTAVTAPTAAGIWRLDVSGLRAVRLVPSFTGGPPTYAVSTVVG